LHTFRELTDINNILDSPNEKLIHEFNELTQINDTPSFVNDINNKEIIQIFSIDSDLIFNELNFKKFDNNNNYNNDINKFSNNDDNYNSIDIQNSNIE